MTDIPTWFLAVFSLSIVGNLVGLLIGLAYAVNHQDMVNVAEDFRYYMRELVPDKYHVQGHRPAEMNPDMKPARAKDVSADLPWSHP